MNNNTPRHRTFNTLDLYNHAVATPELRDHVFADDDENDETNLLQYCDSMTPELQTYYDDMSLYAYDADAHTVTFDMSSLDVILAVCEMIHFEYDAPADREKLIAWNVFKLSGDDDVDYNASYPEILIEIVKSYAAAHPV